MSEMLMLYRGVPDLLNHFQLTTMDVGQVFNRELGRDWTKPGEILQFHLENGSLHIWIMQDAQLARFFGGEAVYHVAFGEAPGPLSEALSLDELKAAVMKYLCGGG